MNLTYNYRDQPKYKVCYYDYEKQDFVFFLSKLNFFSATNFVRISKTPERINYKIRNMTNYNFMIPV